MFLRTSSVARFTVCSAPPEMSLVAMARNDPVGESGSGGRSAVLSAQPKNSAPIRAIAERLTEDDDAARKKVRGIPAPLNKWRTTGRSLPHVGSYLRHACAACGRSVRL